MWVEVRRGDELIIRRRGICIDGRVEPAIDKKAQVSISTSLVRTLYSDIFKYQYPNRLGSFQVFDYGTMSEYITDFDGPYVMLIGSIDITFSPNKCV